MFPYNLVQAIPESGLCCRNCLYHLVPAIFPFFINRRIILSEQSLYLQTEQLNRERVLLDEKNKNACEGHPNVDAAGTNVRGPTGTGLTGSGTTGQSSNFLH